MRRGSAVSYFHADALGSILALSDASGQLTERYAYDAWGSPRLLEPIPPTRTGPFSSPAGNTIFFTGRDYEAALGLYDYRARVYTPALGRFLQRDPLGTLPDVNVYRYVGNNPANWVDPLGLDKNATNFSDLWNWKPAGWEQFYYNTLQPPINTLIYPGYNYGQWTVNQSWRNFYGASLDSLWVISGISGAIEGVVARGTPYYQYYPSNDPTYQTRWMVRGSQPPYRPGQEAVEALNLSQPRNPGTAVRPVEVRWWEPIRGPRLVEGGTGQEYYRGWRWPDQ